MKFLSEKNNVMKSYHIQKKEIMCPKEFERNKAKISRKQMDEKNGKLSHGGRHSKLTCIQQDKNQLISSRQLQMEMLRKNRQTFMQHNFLNRLSIHQYLSDRDIIIFNNFSMPAFNLMIYSTFTNWFDAFDRVTIKKY